MEKLHLEDAFDDTPQTRHLLGVFENDTDALRCYVVTLHRCCNRVITAQKELCAATQFLSSHLKSYGQQQFPLESDESILSSVLVQFAQYMDELSSMQQIMVSQLSDTMMHPVNRFLQADIDELGNMKEMFQIASDDVEKTLAAYMRYSRKREGEKGRQDVNNDLYVSRKKFHQTALHYFALLNSLQYKRKSSLLEPLLGFIQTLKTFFIMGSEMTSRKELDDFIANITASVQGVQTELKSESQQRIEQIEAIEQQSIHKYFAEVPEDVPDVPPNTQMSQKAGYLFLRSKPSLLTSRWDRAFFFIQGGNLMSQSRDEVAGSLILDLNIDTRTELGDHDDRRFVFQVVQPSTRKSLILQAENAHERDEWMATIMNVVKEGQRLVSTEPLTSTVHTPTDAPHGFLASIPVAIPKVVESLRESSGLGRSSHPPTPHSTPAEGAFYPNAPIQFDLLTPAEPLTAQTDFTKESPPNSVFAVRFLGLQEVMMDRGEQLVRETIRQVMAARAIHNVFKMSEFQLVIGHDSLRLYDQVGGGLRLNISLEHISYWAVHNENKRLFGFITRHTTAETKFFCFVFECNSSGDEICQTLATATQLAFQAFMQKKALEMQAVKEKEQLLANTEQLPDQTQTPQQPPSADGQLVLQDNNASASSDAAAPSEASTVSKDTAAAEPEA